MKCDANCFSGTIMMPPLPGKSFGYLILCPTCKGTGTSKFVCRPVSRSASSEMRAPTK